jgi:hypothetical protein
MHRNAENMKRLLIAAVKAVGERKAEFIEEAKKAKVCGFLTYKQVSKLIKYSNSTAIGNTIGHGWRLHSAL